jgi:hypothetical protein
MLLPDFIFPVNDKTRAIKYYQDCFPVYFNIKHDYLEPIPIKVKMPADMNKEISLNVFSTLYIDELKYEIEKVELIPVFK